MKGDLLRAVPEALGLLSKLLSRTSSRKCPVEENTSEQLKCVSVQGGGTQQCPLHSQASRDRLEGPAELALVCDCVCWTLWARCPRTIVTDQPLATTIPSTGLSLQLREAVCPFTEGH